MRKMMTGAALMFAGSTFAEVLPEQTATARDFVPGDYHVVGAVQGDLNQNQRDDWVFLVSRNDEGESGGKDQGRTGTGESDGLLVVFNEGDGYRHVLSNLDCLASDSEEGGVYFAPEPDVSIDRGNLYIHFRHGRYGHWTYNFRYQGDDFELIGYDSTQQRGPVVERSVSINLLTKRMLIRENINHDAEGGDEEFEETWKEFALPQPIRLGEIGSFEALDVKAHMKLLD